MKLPTANARSSELNVQSPRFERAARGFARRQLGPAFIPRSGAFTLIELILVMALVTIVVSVSLPSLKGFFRGRDLDSEARRFLSLTRYGASRAVAEGIPVELYIDTQQKLYGLRAQAGVLADEVVRSSARRTDVTTASRRSGLVTKSYAPSFMASTAVSIVP